MLLLPKAPATWFAGGLRTHRFRETRRDRVWSRLLRNIFIKTNLKKEKIRRFNPSTNQTFWYCHWHLARFVLGDFSNCPNPLYVAGECVSASEPVRQCGDCNVDFIPGTIYNPVTWCLQTNKNSWVIIAASHVDSFSDRRVLSNPFRIFWWCFHLGTA